MKMAENTEERLPPFGILTSDGRTEWAKARDALIKGLSSNVSLIFITLKQLQTILRQINQDMSFPPLSRSNQQGLSGPDRELSVCGVSGRAQWPGG